MTEVYVAGKRVRLDPTAAIGKGAEADIYDLGNGQALKLFKQPGHPDLQGQPAEQQAAKQRLNEHQRKLRDFPRQLPERVIAPAELVTDSDGRKVLGYTMKLVAGSSQLVRLAEPSARNLGPGGQAVVQIFRDLHTSLQAIHAQNVIVGDFNDLNVLVKGAAAYLIDADSFQFGSYLCYTFMERFVDPLLCDPMRRNLVLAMPHNQDSDWYGFSVMLMQSLLLLKLGPYGGIHKPKDPSRLLLSSERPLRRMTVFDPDVRYPKPATPLSFLPDELLEKFRRMFVQDERGVFPSDLLDNLRWTKCLKCGTEHARAVCPVCQLAPAAAVKQTVRIRGQVTATRLFRTHGTIVAAEVQNGRINWLSHEGGGYRREDGTVVGRGQLEAGMRFRLSGATTIVAAQGRAAVIGASGQPTSLIVDQFDRRPQIDANAQSYFWSSQGNLYKRGTWAPELVGQVLHGQTRFWVGDKFGFGFYRAGELTQGFVFRTDRLGINDRVTLPPMTGQIVDATAVMSDQLGWFFWTAQDGGRLVNHAAVITPAGEVIALGETQVADGSWLGTIGGKAAAGKFLLAPTDDGIARVEVDGGQAVVTRTFPDTEEFVSSAAKLLTAPDGVYVVTTKEVVRLSIK